MSSPELPAFAVEATPEGHQSLVPGVAPITLADRLAWRAAQPLAPAKPQRSCDLGLFDLNARAQLELFAPRANLTDKKATDQLPPPEPGSG